MIIDPWGKILVEAEEKQTILYADIGNQLIIHIIPEHFDSGAQHLSYFLLIKLFFCVIIIMLYFCRFELPGGCTEADTCLGSEKNGFVWSCEQRKEIKYNLKKESFNPALIHYSIHTSTLLGIWVNFSYQNNTADVEVRETMYTTTNHLIYLIFFSRWYNKYASIFLWFVFEVWI